MRRLRSKRRFHHGHLQLGRGGEIKPREPCNCSRRSCRRLSRGLRAEFPDVTLITEEQAAAIVKSLDISIVDPLDGTKEFINRRGDFIEHCLCDGVPVRGVVYAPAKNRLFYTDADGQTLEESGDFDPASAGPTAPISVRSPDNSKLAVVASKSHRSPELEEYIGKYEVEDSKAAGSSLKFCLIAG